MNDNIILQLPKFKIALDPTKEPQGNIIFISHSHADHMLRKKTPIPKLCSLETEKLVSARRNHSLINTINEELSINNLNLRMVDTGHVLGSRALVIENDKKIVFTSDFTLREREFLGKFIPEKCDYAILEATFGKEKYIFPPSEEIVKDAKDWIEEQFKKGCPVVLMGYTLGKAQLLCKIFEDFAPIYLDKNIKKINDIYRECGVPLLDFERFGQNKQLKIPPWILITSPQSGRAKLMRKVNAKTAFFSGWAIDEESYVHRMKVDRVFPLSDHADFNELVETVETCNPEKVFVSHGYDHEFAAHLRKLGFDAEPLSFRESPLIDFSEI
ncbi:MBL fold metallo-hydrolase RNA specificity domain-containing protein [Candidatus Borrarchaeum sp.]|uniref:MBL fold metallo-hydrolase RNA specificity domain-containing protein n=1 Tax=Candidatus Borrarchaeum sp. TaxID=2846742 RepID=UPI00257AEC70|nr:MBL fold metallo-hydrolase RNA specificity domain-containing protein [Candidatus Borrarchaeum sp.]